MLLLSLVQVQKQHLSDSTFKDSIPMTTTGRNKPSEMPSQTFHHKHKHNKNTEFSWSHTKLDSLMTMAGEAPISHQGWDLL